MRSKNRILMVFVLLVFGLGNASAALGQYRISQSEVQNLIRRIETRTDSLSRNLVNALDRSAINGTAREDEINRLVRDFEYATDQLRTRVESRQSTTTDARGVLDRAALINRFLLSNRLDYRVEQDWQLLRADLDQLAVAFNLGWRWDTTTGPISGSGNVFGDLQTRQLAQRIAVAATRFRRSFDMAVNRAAINNSSAEYQLRGHVGEFQLAANRLRDRVNRRQATAAEVQQLLEHSRQIDTFMRTYELTPRAENDWSTLRTDLSALANTANIAWNWDTTIPGGPVYGNAQLTGTYRIDSASGDDPRTVAENATRNLPTQRRDRIYQNLLNRLSPPDMLAIDQRGRNVIIASSKAPQVSLVADGREHVETTPQGRTARVRASLSGDQLIIARTGERAQDFTVTFDPIDSNRLLVTRQLYTEQVGQAVTVRTYYTRTADVAQLDIHSSSPQYPTTGTSSGDFVVPNGTQLLATLDTSLSTNNVREGDRFTMTVRDGQYQGAVIEGRVTNVSRSGRVTGRSELGLDFDTIRLRDGRSYQFAGILEGVRTASGDIVRVDNEGAVRDSNQTTRTIQRGAIGAAIGAIIGAIAGGGQGAAIGAAVGAGAGAGSVYVQGRDDLQLEPGTEVTIRASGPR
jgi:hypothetical protein